MQRFWIVLLVVVWWIPVRQADAQEGTTEWQVAHNQSTGRVVVYTVEDRAAQIIYDFALPEPNFRLVAWRLGPQVFALLISNPTTHTTHLTYIVSPDGVKDISSLIDWSVFAKGYAWPYLYAHSKLILFDLQPPPHATSLVIIDVANRERYHFASVDVPTPRLSVDGTTLRFMARVEDTGDDWALMAFDLTTNGLTVFDALRVTSNTRPLIGSDFHGERWLLNLNVGVEPQLVNLDGTTEMITSPLSGSNLKTWMFGDHVLQLDMDCLVNCVVYGRPAAENMWSAYTLPATMAMETAHVLGTIGDDLYLKADPDTVWVVRPNGTAELIGYQNPHIGYAWSSDNQYVVVAASAEPDTTYYVYSFERHQVLFGYPSPEYPIVEFGPASVAIHYPTREIYHIRTGRLVSLPTPPNRALDLVGLIQLPDGSVLMGGTEVEGEVTHQYVFWYDPARNDPPTVILEGVLLANIEAPIIAR